MWSERLSEIVDLSLSDVKRREDYITSVFAAERPQFPAAKARADPPPRYGTRAVTPYAKAEYAHGKNVILSNPTKFPLFYLAKPRLLITFATDNITYLQLRSGGNRINSAQCYDILHFKS